MCVCVCVIERKGENEPGRSRGRGSEAASCASLSSARLCGSAHAKSHFAFSSRKKSLCQNHAIQRENMCVCVCA